MATSVPLNAQLESRVSKEGNPYMAVVIKLTDSCEKLVFLEPAELELVKLTYGGGQKVKLSNSSSES